MATPVSIAIRRDGAQARIQAAAMALAAMHDMGDVDLAPRHKQPEIQTVMTLEAVADFLEGLATAENDAKPAPVVVATPGVAQYSRPQAQPIETVFASTVQPIETVFTPPTVATLSDKSPRPAPRKV